MVIMLAQRLRPKERLDFDQAMAELERAVAIAVDVKEHGVRGTNEDQFIETVIAEAEADKQFAIAGADTQLTMTWFGMVLRINHSANIRLCDAIEAGKVSTSEMAAILGALGIFGPAVAAIIKAIFSLGSAMLRAADSASKGIVLTILWIGPAWCRSQ
jgi:hypothetical protein